MADREKVIKGLECAETMLRQAVDRGGEMSVMVAFRCMNRVSAALALLKVQEQIVRCKHCRHYNTECCSDGYGWCHRRDFGTNDEWYCADGEAGTYEAD